MKKWSLFLVSVALAACAALGLGAPSGRALPLTVKESDELGRCASSGYEVDIPPHVTVATVASICVRAMDAGRAADSGTTLPSSSPPLYNPYPNLPPSLPSDGGDE